VQVFVIFIVLFIVHTSKGFAQWHDSGNTLHDSQTGKCALAILTRSMAIINVTHCERTLQFIAREYRGGKNDRRAWKHRVIISKLPIKL